MKIIKVSSVDELLTAIEEQILGFRPEDSLVVVGMKANAPTARVDLEATADMKAALISALPYWQDSGVLVVQYGMTPARPDLEQILPGIQIIGAFQFCDLGGIGVILEWDGTVIGMHQSSVGTRADKIKAAEKINDADEAEMLAVAAYKSGDGATAWIMHDRARDLGKSSSTLESLARHLLEAIPPSEGTL